MARTGDENYIKKVGGKEETRRFLAGLGFVPGAHVTIIAEIERSYRQVASRGA